MNNNLLSNDLVYISKYSYSLLFSIIIIRKSIIAWKNTAPRKTFPLKPNQSINIVLCDENWFARLRYTSLSISCCCSAGAPHNCLRCFCSLFRTHFPRFLFPLFCSVFCYFLLGHFGKILIQNLHFNRFLRHFLRQHVYNYN